MRDLRGARRAENVAADRRKPERIRDELLKNTRNRKASGYRILCGKLRRVVCSPVPLRSSPQGSVALGRGELYDHGVDEQIGQLFVNVGDE